MTEVVTETGTGDALMAHSGPPELPIVDVQRPAVVDICVGHFETLAPLHRWLVKALG